MAKEIICAHCQTRFWQPARSSKFCSVACWKVYRKASPKSCVNCGCIFTPIKWHARANRWISHNAGKTCSPQCANMWIRVNPERKRKIGLAFAGDRHPNWQGGKAQLNNISNRGPNWTKQRRLALKRDHYRCVLCKLSEDNCRLRFGRGLDVDHKVPFHNFGNYRNANVLSNLQSVCASCHKIEESKRSMVQMVLPMQDGTKRTHKRRACGERINTATLTAMDVLEIRRLKRSGESAKTLAARNHTSVTNIYGIVRGKTWKHLPL